MEQPDVELVLDEGEVTDTDVVEQPALTRVDFWEDAKECWDEFGDALVMANAWVCPRI